MKETETYICLTKWSKNQNKKQLDEEKKTNNPILKLGNFSKEDTQMAIHIQKDAQHH